MSPSTSTNDHGVVATDGWRVPAAVKAGAFWAAVVLPFCALALLYSGLETGVDYVTLASLLVGNVVALVVGHDYGQ
jgi:hypothetical protein